MTDSKTEMKGENLEKSNDDKKKTKFITEAAPHVHSGLSKKLIMWCVVLALLPATINGIHNFGIRSLYIILLSLATTIFCEGLFNWLRGKPLSRLLNAPAVVTGLLLGISISPTVPFWIPVLGGFVAMAIGKHAFGGAGMTMFNPALVGRAFLVVSFPSIMTQYIGVDGITGATPLTALKLQGYESVISTFGSKFLAYKAMFLGNIGGSIGETSAMLLLLGGLFLILMRIVDWRIPTIYIGTVFAGTFLLGQDPLFHILGGGLFLGAFFMATDYAGMPITKSGRVYFAIGLGLLTVLIRIFGGLPEAVNYPILIMNAFSPLIERLTKPKPFGMLKVKGVKK